MTETPVPTGKEFDPLVAELVTKALRDEQFATSQISLYEHKAKEWRKHRQEKRDIVLRALGGQGIGRFQGQELVVVAPKEQFNGTEFKKAYPELHAQAVRVRAEEYVDWDYLATEYPDVVAKFQVQVFTNKVDS